MITLYQFMHGLAAYKDIEDAVLGSRMFLYHLSGPVLNSFENSHFWYSKLHWAGYNNLIGGMGRQYFLHKPRCIMIFINY